jgi:hypothetical protein
MRFNKSAVPAAMLVALSLTTSFTAQAAPKDELALLASLPNLAVESTNHASEQTLVIRNRGGVTAPACHMRITSSTGAVYYMPIMELAPGAVQYLWLSDVRSGKPSSIRIEADCDQEVTEATEADNDVMVRFIQ